MQPSNCENTHYYWTVTYKEAFYEQKQTKLQCPYCALVGFFPSMPAHVDHQHVLRLEGLLLSRAVLPPAHKLLLLPMDVVIVDVLRKKTNKL